MNLRTALQVTVILGWAGLVVELTRMNPGIISIIAAALLFGWFARNR